MILDAQNMLALHFNPRSREGSDKLRLLPLLWTACHFNPRSREGSDPP